MMISRFGSALEFIRRAVEKFARDCGATEDDHCGCEYDTATLFRDALHGAAAAMSAVCRDAHLRREKGLTEAHLIARIEMGYEVEQSARRLARLRSGGDE